MNFLILTQKYNFNPICFIMDDSNIKCRGSQAVRRLSRKQLRESVQGLESFSRRRFNTWNPDRIFETKTIFCK